MPTIVLLRGHTLLSKISGANVSAVTDALNTLATPDARQGGGLSRSNAAPHAAGSTYEAVPSKRSAPEEPAPSDGLSHAPPPALNLSAESTEQTDERCRELMTRSPVMLFMKGQPSQPQCGFSQKTVALLREQKIDFDYYNILSDENVRQRLKVLNDWPTFPQIIVNGELIGGLDILKVRLHSAPR